MRHVLAGLWPRSLAGRLTLLLVVALAMAQLALTLVLRTQQDSMVEGLIHSQALNQTVTLARLLNASPIADDARLTDAFGSRQSCSNVSATAPPARQMSAAEQRLADGLSAMLHGIRAGAPQVAIEPKAQPTHPCDENLEPSAATPAHAGGAEGDGDGDQRHEDAASVAMSVPLLDGRWLTVRTMVGMADGLDRVTVISFLLSCIVVAAVAIVSVRVETRSLRALADASDRFGRGETVLPLQTTGPLEVAAATQAFNTMQERLSTFMRERLRLLASVSHDLRTPLTTLRLKAEFIEDEAARDSMIATIDELTTICEATLAFTRAEATSEATTSVDLRDLVEDVAADFRLAGKSIEDGTLESVEYSCRPVALKRAIRNLVENGVRYGGGVRLSVERRADLAVIDIDDQGPGLPPDQIENAFEPFVRLEPSRSVETGGIGLGLSIARSIVRAHGGTLTLTNRPEGGLRAEISLPWISKLEHSSLS